MDKIWNRNPSKSEVIGRCGGNEKTEWPRRTDKSQTPKKLKKIKLTYVYQTIVYIMYRTVYGYLTTYHIRYQIYTNTVSVLVRYIYLLYISRYIQTVMLCLENCD